MGGFGLPAGVYTAHPACKQAAIRPLLESWTPGQDGMRCALLLFIRAAISGLLHKAGFSERRFDRCVISLFASRPGKNHKAQSSCNCTGHYAGPVWFTLGEHRPGHAGQMIGQGHNGYLGMRPRGELRQPGTQAGRLFCLEPHRCACALHKQPSQVGGAPLADTAVSACRQWSVRVERPPSRLRTHALYGMESRSVADGRDQARSP